MSQLYQSYSAESVVWFRWNGWKSFSTKSIFWACFSVKTRPLLFLYCILYSCFLVFCPSVLLAAVHWLRLLQSPGRGLRRFKRRRSGFQRFAANHFFSVGDSQFGAVFLSPKHQQFIHSHSDSAVFSSCVKELCGIWWLDELLFWSHHMAGG